MDVARVTVLKELTRMLDRRVQSVIDDLDVIAGGTETAEANDQLRDMVKFALEGVATDGEFVTALARAALNDALR